MQLQPARCIGVAAHQFARRTTLFQVLQPRIASKDREIAPKPSYQHLLSQQLTHSCEYSKQEAPPTLSQQQIRWVPPNQEH